MTERRPSLIRRILHEPLLHFALLGAAVFAAYLALHPTAASDERTIVVDRGHLLNFMQNRAKAFDRPHFAEVLDTMSPRALDDLIKDYVREEAMYREAKSLKLEDRDYVARRRLVQQLEIITRGFVADAKPLTDADLAKYYAAHKRDYAEPPAITFTHVFFDRSKHGDRTEALARAELAELNADKVPFDRAMGHGDRPLYGVNYVGETKQNVAGDLGQSFGDAVFGLKPEPGIWQGPFESKYGVELVMVTALTEGGAPPFAEVKDRVKADAGEADRKAKIDAAVESIVKSYKVDVEAVQRPEKEPKS